MTVRLQAAQDTRKAPSPGAGEQEVGLRFFDSTVSPLSFRLGGDEKSEFTVPFAAPTAKSLTTEGDALRVGYGVIESFHPIAAQVTYRLSGPQRNPHQVTFPDKRQAFFTSLL